MEKAIFESCRIKKEIIEQDEQDQGKRQILNFGHTIGHALETVSGYVMSHGEAVAIGMLVESHIALQLGYLCEKALGSIRKILKMYEISLEIPLGCCAELIWDAMAFDKKAFKGKPKCVVLKDLGKVQMQDQAYCMAIEKEHVIKAFKWFKEEV